MSLRRPIISSDAKRTVVVTYGAEIDIHDMATIPFRELAMTGDEIALTLSDSTQSIA